MEEEKLVIRDKIDNSSDKPNEDSPGKKTDDSLADNYMLSCVKKTLHYSLVMVSLRGSSVFRSCSVKFDIILSS